MADDFEIPDESEQLDQLQSEDTLVDRGVDDVLDEGYTAPEKWSVAQGFGNTAAEQAAGESFEQRLAQEEPDPEIGAPIPRWNLDGEEREVGSRRAGRLVDLHGIVTDGAQIGAEVASTGERRRPRRQPSTSSTPPSPTTTRTPTELMELMEPMDSPLADPRRPGTSGEHAGEHAGAGRVGNPAQAERCRRRGDDHAGA